MAEIEKVDVAQKPTIKNAAFREYTTNNAFVLTLSKNQIDALACVVEVQEDGCYLSGVVVSSLMRRGLIEVHKAKENRVADRVVSSHLTYRPTFAGKLMYRLLCEAGLVYSREHPMAVCPIDCTEQEWKEFDSSTSN